MEVVHPPALRYIAAARQLPITKKMKILIIDAESLMRDGLSALLALQEDIEVVGAIDDIAAASSSAPPDLVLLDTLVPDYEGSSTIASLRGRWPGVRVTILTFRRDELSVRGALRAGVDGYLLKSDTRVELAHALRAMREGTRYISPAVSERSTDREVGRTSPVAMEALSDRERLVMTRIAQGRRTREIATELSLSAKTIEKYRGTLMRKLGLKTAAAVAAFAIANGYVEL